MMRLNKYIAHCGIDSRRKTAEFVKQGLVTVNGIVEKSPAYIVQEGDVVRYRDKIIKPEENMVYILMNKPKRTITSLNDEKGRKTVMDIVKSKVPERIYPVGRLDYLTTGLLLLTNDGDLTKKLSHPSHNVPKVYQVTLDKELNSKDFKQIESGFELEDGAVKVDWIRKVEGEHIYNLEIHIGKNRIVRRIFEHFGYSVKKLDRIYYAGLTKKGLTRGWFRHLTEREIIMLKHFT